MRRLCYVSLTVFAGLAFFVLVFSSAAPVAESPSVWDWLQTGSLATVSGLIGCGLAFLIIKLFGDF